MSPEPFRVQLRRASGWRMPPGTVKVDRSTKWGNPFVVGRYGTAGECLDAYRVILTGYLIVGGSASTPSPAAQRAYRERLVTHYRELVGRNLACWCRPGAPCHADVLMQAVALLEKGNRP